MFLAVSTSVLQMVFIIFYQSLLTATKLGMYTALQK